MDDAVAALNDLDPPARKVAQELQTAVESVHRAGLVTIVRRLRADDSLAMCSSGWPTTPWCICC